MTQVTIQSASIVYSGNPSEEALKIAEDYAYNHIEDSEQYINDEGLFCDKDGNIIDLMDGCDFGDLPDSEWGCISVEVSY